MWPLANEEAPAPAHSELLSRQDRPARVKEGDDSNYRQVGWEQEHIMVATEIKMGRYLYGRYE